MNLGVIIEVAIGVVFVWLVISLSTIQIQEWIASGLKFREKDLEKTIGKMLANPQLTKEFYNHPLIRSFAKKPGERPTYIPPREFTQALFNVFITAGTENSAIQQSLASVRTDVFAKNVIGLFKQQSVQNKLNALIDEVTHFSESETESIMDQLCNNKKYQELQKIPEIKNAVERIPLAVRQYLDAASDANITSNLANLTPEQIEKGIIAIGKINPSLERTMKSMIAGITAHAEGADKALAVAHSNVESWFNNSMESLSGLYKRRSQWITFIIGMFLAVSLSVDSLSLIQVLWIDPSLRAALVENSSQLVNESQATPTPTTAPETTTSNVNQVTTSASETPSTQPSPKVTVEGLKATFGELGLPFGWTMIQTIKSTVNKDETAPKYQCALIPEWSKGGTEGITLIQGVTIGKYCYRPISTTTSSTLADVTAYDRALKNNWLFTWVIGVLITALATVQGAPFWFDILKNIINLRSAGARPPTTPGIKAQK